MTSSKLINHQKRILVREDDRPITIKERILKRVQMFAKQRKRIWEITIMAMPE